jgi:hypothetical protein
MNTIGAYGDFKQERQIGEYTIYLPDPPNLRAIANRDLPLSQQKWRRNGFSLKKFDKLTKAEQTKFVREEWNRRENGYWWMNGGSLEYATGLHWMYMEHWYLENTYPNFVDRDRDFFWLWKFGVEDDPNCGGLVLIGKRRDGKTHRGNIIVYEGVSKATQAKGGIQSKTDKDAKKVFGKMIRQWKRLPFYFRPLDEGDDSPKEALRFYAPKQVSRKGDQRFRQYQSALESEIGFESVTDEAYDGDKLLRYFSDEFAKTIKGDVHARSLVTKECMVVGTNIVGKQIWTSTVEEMEKKGGRNGKKVFEEADPNNLTENGRTINSMKRLFVPASVGMEGDDPLDGKPFIDEFGYSRVEKAEAYIRREYNSLKGETKRAFRRKYPLRIADAFLVESDGGHFDEDKIDAQLEYLPTWTGKLRRGRFEWSNGFGSRPVWKDGDEPEKYFFNALIFMDNPKLGKSYNVGHDIDGEVIPMNTSKIVAGVDPFDHKKTADGKSSKAAAYFFLKINPADPNNTNIIAMEYYGRRKTPNQFYEDMLMACLYYGCQINPENTKSGIINYFDDKGYGKFIMKRPDSAIDPNARGRGADTDGTPSNTTFVINAHLAAMIEYVDAYAHLVYFKELLEELLRFDVNNRTEFDRCMAFGYTLLAALAKKTFNAEVEAANINDFYEEYGSESVYEQENWGSMYDEY